MTDELTFLEASVRYEDVDDNAEIGKDTWRLICCTCLKGQMCAWDEHENKGAVIAHINQGFSPILNYNLLFKMLIIGWLKSLWFSNWVCWTLGTLIILIITWLCENTWSHVVGIKNHSESYGKTHWQSSGNIFTVYSPQHSHCVGLFILLLTTIGPPPRIFSREDFFFPAAPFCYLYGAGYPFSLSKLPVPLPLFY